jgi:segregation and condensation protein B
MVDAEPANDGDVGLTPSLEALLIVLDRPLEVDEVAAAWSQPAAALENALTAIADSYERDGRGLRLRRSASGWRLYAAPEAADRVRAVVVQETTARLSPAALETLAVIAYQQPVSRSRVAAVRGVNVDAVVRTLTVRGLVEPGDPDPVTGALLYRTTTAFLDAIGVGTLDELPSLPPLLPDVATIGADSAEGSI